jgi:hypothetical protein
VIGPRAADVIFQSGERGHEEHTQAGTLEGWREGIAAKAEGNPLLMLAISASFAGPLMQRCNSEGGGFHVVGDSSTGKTTLIEAACATWGGPGFKRSWRATANGMEGATIAGAIALAIGIGIQNFPEGFAVAMPLRRAGASRTKSFMYGQLSAIVEPSAGVIGAMAVIYMEPILPFALSFAAGAMIFVVVEEVIPETQRDKYTDIAVLGFIGGFLVMMILDVALG